MAFNNSIALASKYLPILDEVYKRASVTSILDTANDRIKFLGGNSVQVYKTDLNGLGNYDRNAGYVDGSATGTWETMALTKDRGRRFLVDEMDNEETLGQALGTLVGEFIRVMVAPEVDAYRFAKYAGTSGILSATADITIGTTDVASLIDTAEKEMGDAEVPEDGRVLFISESAYAGLKAKITRTILNGENNINTVVDTYDGMRVIKVPQGRFNTAITLYDGKTSGQTAGGFIVPASTSYKINFMIIHPSAVLQVVKHQSPKMISPAQNPDADGWLFGYRLYHDAFVLANKVKGIYMHRASTANA